MSKPIFQRRHYRTIADILANTIIQGPEIGLSRETHFEIAKDFASDFAADNPQFDRARFLAACGIEQ